ncbi:unnamed protein product [Gongylonema pulchrum]|uniref:Glycoside hydrolase family 2 catalytic domain-containing protein n=1 Tax=Gongylonema pulchrum TaxID=637853 RepID=A0A3P6S955_9BILA|nr:unnamed protein product [Gongylonema pulchrum]
MLDVICINRYFGWYVDTGYLETINNSWVFEISNWKQKYRDKPLIVSEYGAEAIPGFNQVRQRLILEKNLQLPVYAYPLQP